MRRAWQAAALAGVIFISATGETRAETNLLFILDASGSMWGKAGDQVKITTAKAELTKLLKEVPAETQLGLMVYGHRSKSDCQDVELMAPIGAASAADIAGKIKGLNALGKTPIGYSLVQSVKAFTDRKGQNNNVVLISDGIESCDGDPCKAAAALAEAEIGVRVHVVGFGLTAEENKQLQCIAENGKGKYFTADSTAGFSEAVKGAIETAQATEPPAAPEPAPPPAEKPRKVIFSDQFDGSSLSEENWKLTNPNPDGYIVENGALLMLAAGAAPGDLTREDIPNIFHLGIELPSSDWAIEVRLTAEFATAEEMFSFGVFDDAQNMIVADLYGHGQYSGGGGYATLTASVRKITSGQTSSLAVKAAELGSTGYAAEMKKIAQPITVRLIKEGRTYRTAVNLGDQKDDAGKLVWIATEPVTGLRQPKGIVMNASQAKEVSGETTFSVDAITIDVPE